MPNPLLILELLKNKTKRLNLAFNPKLWEMFKEASLEEGQSPTGKLEDLIINYIHQRGKLE